MNKKDDRSWSNIGRATFWDFDGFRNWYMEQGLEWAVELWPNHFHAKQKQEDGALVCKAFNRLFSFGWGGFPDRSSNPDRVLRESESSFKPVQRLQDYLLAHELSWDVKYVSSDPCYAVVSYGSREENRFVIPDYPRWLNYVPYQDYSALPLQAIKQLAGSQTEVGVGTDLATAGGLANKTVAGVNMDIDAKKAELEKLREERKNVEEAKTGELADLKKKLDELQAQLDMKKELLLAELEEKRAELALQQEKLEMDLFLLESEIYSIRCFLGETVEFLRVRKGRNAPLEEPVVVYQKMHFLDEDLGKYAIMFGEKLNGNFEDALAVSDSLLEMVLPNSKCVSLLKISKDGKEYGRHSEWANMLDGYEVLHGQQLALLVRNGDNVYVGWTEEDRVRLGSEDFFLTPAESRPVEHEGMTRGKYESDEELEQRMKAENKRHFREFVSRYFLFSILNGLSADDAGILPFPKFKSAEERSRHIIYSMADNWLADNRFGSFDDIIERCNSRITKGDYVLTVQSLRPATPMGSGWRNHVWFNDRGIGDANRTHDVSCEDCAVYRINLITEDPPVEMVHYSDREGNDHGWTTRADQVDRLVEGCKILDHYTVCDKHYYVSLEKYWSDCGATANFEIMEGEFINLTYMNSVWLNYVLSTKNVSGWTVGGKAVNYAYALRYIAKALDHIKGREEMEKARIDAACGDESITSNPDWPVWLSEWKLEKNVRQISDYQARRFVAYRKEQKA